MRTMRVIGGRAACGVAMRCALFPDLSALGSGPDAGSMRDATSDAPDATPVFGCKAMADASFCEDFDDPIPLCSHHVEHVGPRFIGRINLYR